MFRFAPSPTRDMHIGNLRVAIFNYLLSKQLNEPLIIRIEDGDKERNIEGKEREILEILDLFGIEYRDVIYQSAHLKFHRGMALQLLNDKKAFNCFCTPARLEAKREAAKAAQKTYRYDGHCENLPPEVTIDNLNPFTIRLKKPAKTIALHDSIKGESSFAPEDIDSFIIMRADKHPTYSFACAVDDMLSDISTVIRDEEHLSDTPKQIAVRQALGYDKAIRYAHVPAILNDEDVSVKWLLEEGFLPDAIANYLIAIGNDVPQEVFSMSEALEWFSLEKISKDPVRFDLDGLRSFNKEHLKRLDAKELSRYVGFADEDIGNLARIYLDEASTLKELRAKIAPVFAPKVIPEALTEDAEILKNVIIKAPHFEAFEDFKSYLMKESGLDAERFSKPLRLLLSGAEHGPEVADMYPYLKNYLGEIVK